ncbi:hypothetical protein E4U43_006211 [Claviceps pusilla]|uniref:Uncharacterized protein n=1 Tax=Claviceps pusilla TaxID=123648 RepID=A0A9P7NG50_9HYPO|nr:hypothetical protein E4U43_006211 [Claviceps pusilla]
MELGGRHASRFFGHSHTFTPDAAQGWAFIGSFSSMSITTNGPTTGREREEAEANAEANADAGQMQSNDRARTGQKQNPTFIMDMHNDLFHRRFSTVTIPTLFHFNPL